MAQGAWAQPLFKLRLAPHRLPLAQATCRAYVCDMLSKSRFNPGPGLIDFWHEFRKPNPYRWPILAVSAAPVGAVLLWFFNDIYYADPARPEVTYITSYAPDRSDAEIEATNVENQRRKDELRTQQEELSERKKQMYRELGRATGLDVDAMEEQIANDKAREEAERKAASPANGKTGE